MTLKEEQREFLEQVVQGTYIIHTDNSITVYGDVYCTRKDLIKIPFKFYKVTGYFNCSWNKLTTLENSPKSVGSFFVSIII